MDTNPDIAKALAYFSDYPHRRSFEIKNGRGKVMLSAPHAVLQTRDGQEKQAERYTGMLCLLMNRSIRCPCIYKTLNLNDDANHDPVSDYRDALCAYIKAHDIRCLLDLHQLSPQRPMAVCLCTGKGRNLIGDTNRLKRVEAAFVRHRLTPVTIDDPFDAASPNTVSATVARLCGVPAIQIELNSRLLIEDQPCERFGDVMAALEEAVNALEGQGREVETC